jgi:hypothetical protein
MNKDVNRPLVYVPANTRINFDNKDQDPPTTQYNTRKSVLDLEQVKKIVGGEYGRKAEKK